MLGRLDPTSRLVPRVWGLSRPSPSSRGMMMARSFMPRMEEDRAALTKIVATIGPVSEQFDKLQQIVRAGMRVMRLNFSHATYEEAELRMKNLRKSQGRHGTVWGETFNVRAVLLDIQGPKIRTGNFATTTVTVEKGQQCVLTTDQEFKTKGTAEKFFVDYKGLYEAAKPGRAVVLDDGNLILEIKSVGPDGVICTALNTARIKDRRGVNLPHAIIDLPALSEKDKENIRFGLKWDIDFIAASFVRKAEDVLEIRKFVAEEIVKHFPADHPHPRIIAKIESTEGLNNFEEILKVADGIMVARGDLGIEIPVEEVTNHQKMMVRRCKLVGKPVIVATQMLESMIEKPRATRAEVSDVTHAVYDGADAVMLSGESAQGKHPVESVATMRSIIDAAEEWQQKNSDIVERLSDLVVQSQGDNEPGGLYDASASAAVVAAQRLYAKCIVVHTKDGEFARVVSRFCPFVPIVAFTSSQKVARQLIIHRGIHPACIPQGYSWNANKDNVVKYLKEMGYCQTGDHVVALTGELQSQDASRSSGIVFMKVA